uniref:AN1-type domain-containing protein n=1 Tax=Araucaria cunninghamii TaxID=56994 RepID=A0A0D6R603_ARACU
MGTPEFPDLGKHCNVEDCKLVDFLPFTCDRCQQVFCLEHRTYSKHQCPNANEHDVTVLVCPMCAKGVRLVPNEDPNITWESHIRTDCDPTNYDKVMKKPRCPVSGCKEILTFANKFKCRDCAQEVCLKHRFGLDHKCPGPKKVDGNFSVFGMFGKSPKEKAVVNGRRANNSGSSSASESLRSGFFAAASNLRASAEAGISKLSIATNDVLSKVKTNTLSRQQAQDQSRQPVSVEECPQCGVQFSSVSALILHVESIHENSNKGGSQELPDICPKCSRSFSDPVSLVKHVEKDHGGTSTH